MLSKDMINTLNNHTYQSRQCDMVSNLTGSFCGRQYTLNLSNSYIIIIVITCTL